VVLEVVYGVVCRAGVRDVGQAIVVLCLLVIKVTWLPHKLWENKEQHFEEVKSKDKGPMSFLWKTRS